MTFIGGLLLLGLILWLFSVGVRTGNTLWIVITTILLVLIGLPLLFTIIIGCVVVMGGG
jgi:hypothetical protein